MAQKIDFDYAVRDGVRVAGSRKGREHARPARVLEIRYDPTPETERRVLRAVAQMLDAMSDADQPTKTEED